MACAVLTLSGCKSSDYRKATELMDNGSYDYAIAIFEELGDYKDSADKIAECKYGSAVSLYDSGDFKGAYEKFKLLGDYGNSKEYVKKAMWEIIYEKYPYTDDITKSAVPKVVDGDYKYAISIAADQEKDGLDIKLITTDLSETYHIIGMTIYENKNDTTVAALYETSVTGNKIDIGGSATLDIDKYNENYKLEWNITVPTSLPELYNSVKSGFDTGFLLMITYLEQEFNSNGLGFTLADIGFTNY